MRSFWLVSIAVVVSVGCADPSGDFFGSSSSSEAYGGAGGQPLGTVAGSGGAAAQGGSTTVVLDQDMLAEASKAAQWLISVAEVQEGRASWPEYIGVPAWEGPIARPVDLYAGVAGISLFLAKTGYLAANETFSEVARAGAEHLAATAKPQFDGYYWEHEQELNNGQIITYDFEGFYVGAAGVGAALLSLAQLLNEPSYGQLAEGAGRWLLGSANSSSEGCSWPLQDTDIIAGNAGIMLFLLELHRTTGQEQFLEGARCAGDWLLGQAVTEGDGQYWFSAVGWDVIYPGFSHGTAGVAYALVALYEATLAPEYLQAAQAGAAWLDQLALCDELGCRWYHSSPDSMTTFATGWCHGTAGTARLFLYLHKLTGNEHYLDTAIQAAQWTMVQADPEAPYPDYWGLSFCCGAASVGDFFVDIYRYTNDQSYRDFGRAVADYLVQLAHHEQGGSRWTNYDHPDDTGRVWFAPGLKLGAAGAGWLFLRLAVLDTEATDWPLLLDERL